MPDKLTDRCGDCGTAIVTVDGDCLTHVDEAAAQAGGVHGPYPAEVDR